jgi:hypothetical protein
MQDCRDDKDLAAGGAGNRGVVAIPVFEVSEVVLVQITHASLL